MDSDKIRKRFW